MSRVYDKKRDSPRLRWAVDPARTFVIHCTSTHVLHFEFARAPPCEIPPHAADRHFASDSVVHVQHACTHGGTKLSPDAL